jgi:hypothetical protein
LLHDKSSGQSLGGALLTFSSKQAADAALQALQMLTLPGADKPLEVRTPERVCECAFQSVDVVVQKPDSWHTYVVLMLLLQYAASRGGPGCEHAWVYYCSTSSVVVPLPDCLRTYVAVMLCCGMQPRVK